MSKLILYTVAPSPPVRAVLITVKALGLNVTEKNVDLLSKEQFNPEFLKLNPQHTVPVLEDNGFVVVDSHAIMTYLVSKYGKNSTLLPTDPQKRSIVDQRLFFNSGTFFIRHGNIVRPVIQELKKTIDDVDRNAIVEAYRYLETFLTGSKFMAGDDVTIADYSIIATLSTTNLYIPVDDKLFPNVINWMRRVEALPEYSANVYGLQCFKDLFTSRLA